VAPAGCFDPTLAEDHTETVPVGDVVDPLHVTHAPERIAVYRNAMLDGAVFPPISVVRFGGRTFVVDGHKRFQAYRALGRQDIVVEVWTRRRWLADQRRQLRVTTRLWRGALSGKRKAAGTRSVRDLCAREWTHWKRLLRSITTRAS